MAKYPVKHHPTAKKTKCLHVLKFRFASELNMESMSMKIRTNLQPRPQNLLQYTDFVLFQFQVPTFLGEFPSVNPFKKLAATRIILDSQKSSEGVRFCTSLP